jgi:hypothetical protein
MPASEALIPRQRGTAGTAEPGQQTKGEPDGDGNATVAIAAVFPGWLTLWLAALGDMGATA